jgi:hypothetical protein
MESIPELFQAFVAPAIFISAAALLTLSLNVRLMGMVTRLRDYQKQHYIASAAGHRAEAEALADQVASIERRAEKIRRAFIFTLLCLAGTILACLLLGLGRYWPQAEALAAFVQVAAILFLLVGTLYYLAEMLVALSSVREEAQMHRFMRLGAQESPEERHREDWTREHTG